MTHSRIFVVVVVPPGCGQTTNEQLNPLSLMDFRFFSSLRLLLCGNATPGFIFICLSYDGLMRKQHLSQSEKS